MRTLSYLAAQLLGIFHGVQMRGPEATQKFTTKITTKFTAISR
jgi:hypothetical protein